MVPFLEAHREQLGLAGALCMEEITKKKRLLISLVTKLAWKALQSSLKKGHTVVLISATAIFCYLIFFFLFQS